MDDRAVSGPGHVRDAQVLGYRRFGDRPESDGSFHEEPVDLGGALLMTQFGSGPLSLDSRSPR